MIMVQYYDILLQKVNICNTLHNPSKKLYLSSVLYNKIHVLLN